MTLRDENAGLALVISDNQTTLDNTAAMLVAMDFEVVIASTELELTRSCAAYRYRLIISDLEMPGGVGFESIATVRGLCDSVHIIAFAGNKHEDMWPKVARACGANQYVAGPLSISSLAKAIEARGDAT